MKNSNKNKLSVDEFFAGYPDSRRIYDAIEGIARQLGSVEVRVTKSQVAFWRTHPFAWAWRPGQYLSGKRPPLVLSVALRRKDPSKRWKEVVEPRPGRFMHHMELASEDLLDDEVLGWLQEAWEAAG